MSGRIETFTSDVESSKWSKNKDINVVKAGVDIGDGSSGGGSNVSVDQVVTSGREVAGVTVDGERTPILIPNAGEWTQSDWAETDPSDDAYIKNKPTLAQVATSGDYGDLGNTPDLSNFVEDSNYVHTDNNYDAGAKNIVDHVTDNLANKVDKVTGKTLSDNNFTNAQKDKLTNLANIYGVGSNLALDPETNILSANAQPITIDTEMSSSSTNAVQNRVITGALADKVDKVTGKVLSDNNFSNSDKQKLDGIDQGAEVNDISTISVNRVNVPADANKNVEITIPTKVSDLSNDSGFITNTVTNLTNYYLKSETYTQAEINTLIAAITTLDIEVVNALPVSDISTTTIYLVPKTTAGTQDVYDEWINIDGTSSGWEHIGSTEIDLTNYYTKSEVNTLLSSKANSSDLATVATSGSYNDLSDKPTIPTVNNGVLAITQNGTTLGTFSANQNNNATIDIPGGGGGLLPHLIINAPTGSAVTATKGTTVITAVETSSGVFECDIPEYGDWTISDGTDSNIISVVNVGLLRVATANGSSIVPVNDVATWLRCAARYETYTTLSEVLSDTNCLSALLANDNASDYLARSTDFAADICANEMAMTYIGLSNHCANVLLAEETVWRRAIIDSSYFESVLNVKAPAMTSANTPEGEAFANSTTSGQVWYPFNGSDVMGDGYWRTSWNSGAILGYKFTRNVRIYKIRTVFNGQHYTQSKSSTYKFQAKNSQTEVTEDITNSITRSYYSNNSDSAKVIENFYPHTIFSDKDTYQYYQTAGEEGTPIVQALQFYGREDV